MAGGGVKINNITVSGGADGKTPIFKIVGGELFNSYDNGTTWYNLGEVKGETGPQGPQGVQGPQGEQGEQGNSPYIGANGNWWIGETDTGVSAAGGSGETGADGRMGAIQLLLEYDGENGFGYHLYVLKCLDPTVQEEDFDGMVGLVGLVVKKTSNDVDNNLSIGDIVSITGVKDRHLVCNTDDGGEVFGSIRGEKGEKGEKGDTGAQGIQGDKGDTGAKGADGKTPVKGVDYFTEADKEEIAEQSFTTKAGQEIIADIAEINDVLAPLKEESLNIFNGEIYNGKIRPNRNGESQITQIIGYTNSWSSKQGWKCKKGDVIRSNLHWVTCYMIYDANGVLITNSYFSGDYTVVDENAAQFTIQSFDIDAANPSTVMITLNNPMPPSYTPYVDTPTIGDISNNKRAIKDLQNGLPYFKKAFVVLSFDAFHLADNRFSIVNDEYRYRATVAHKTVDNIDTHKKILKAGWDIGLYNLHGSPARVEGQYDAAVSKTPTAEILQAWEDYVKVAVDEAAEAMAYNPVVWLAQQGCSCYGLEMALKKYGIPMCRGNYNPDYSNDWDYSPTKLPTMTVAPSNTLMPSTLTACKEALAQAVENGTGVAFLTHGIYATDAEANSNYGITEACLRSFLDTVKSYVDAGQLEVLTYRDIYARYYPEKARELDYNRIIKMMLHKTAEEETLNYTNLLPTAVGLDGAVYNGKGFKENTRQSSGGEAEMTGVCFTGFIPAKKGDIVYLKNITMKDTTSSGRVGVALYTEIGTTSQFASLINIMKGNAGYGVVLDGDNCVQFNVTLDCAYIRICADVISDDSIITINEPID